MAKDKKKKNKKKTIPEKRQQRPLSRNRKIVFSIIAVSIPFLFLILLEVFLRMANYRGDLNLFIYPDRFGGEYGMLNHHYHEKFFFRTNTFSAGRGDVFLKNKPDDAFRVFVLGASTTESFPYGYNGMFSLVIRDMLTDVLPDRHVEVVNLGITATNTYTLYDQTREILRAEPDAILIYSGQNEYYGALGVASSEGLGRNTSFVRATMVLYRVRTFLMLRDGIGWLLNKMSGYDKHEAPGTLMQRLAQQHAIPLEGKVFEAGKRQYASNLGKILQRYTDAGVPVFISSLVSNLKDHPPFYSLETGDHPPADQMFERALMEYQNEEYEHALQTYRYARDLDALRFRAPAAMNEIIRDKADAFGAFYVPMKEKMSARAENGIIGSDLMLEHLHPNSEGYFLMGLTFFESLMEANLPELQPDMNRLKSPDEYRDAMVLTELDHKMVWHRVQALMNSWPFVDEPDPEGYPANFTPENELDRLAINHVREHISWEQAKTRMAMWYSENGMHDEAITEIMGAIRVVPYEEEAWRFAGRLAMQANRPQKAIEFLTEAIQVRRTADAYRMLGTIYFDIEEFELAASNLREAYNLNRDDLSSLFNASVAYASNDQFEDALAVAEQIARVYSGYPNIQAWILHLQREIAIQR